MAEKQKHRERMLKEGYRETRPGYYTKTNPPKTEFNSTQDALDHHDSQHDSLGLIDNAISNWSGGGGK